MNGITTIAAIPSGAGQAAHLKAEVGEPRRTTLVPMADYFKQALDFPAIDADMLDTSK